MQVRLIRAVRVGAVALGAGAILGVSEAAALQLIAEGAAVPARPSRETATAPVPERAISPELESSG